MTWAPIARRQRFPKGAKADNPWLAVDGAPCSLAEAVERNMTRALHYSDTEVFVVVWTA